MYLARLALPLVPMMLSVTASPAVAGILQPHRAVYDLHLEEATDRSGITGISGRMVYDFHGSACDGYAVTFRFVTRIDTDEISRITDQQTTTYEEGDGSSFSFVTRSFIDGQLDQELKGTASAGKDGTDVALEKPEESTFTLDLTQFPTRHMLELIDNAEKGETFYETTLFDGSDAADKVMTTTVVIGNETRSNEGDPEYKALGALANDSYWPVDVAYFDVSDGDEIPTYRISFKLHRNGLTRDLVMDYGDFSMEGKLVELQLSASEPARKEKEEPKARPQRTGFHQVTSGETLWSIAQQYYGSDAGSKIRSIAQANRYSVRNPNRIFPGQMLAIPQTVAQQAKTQAQAPAAEPSCDD